jgi:hypothetical protein
MYVCTYIYIHIYIYIHTCIEREREREIEGERDVAAHPLGYSAQPPLVFPRSIKLPA